MAYFKVLIKEKEL